MSHTQLATVDFHGQALTVITANGQRLVAMKPICEGIGLQWEAQLKRMKRDEVLSTCMSMVDIQMPPDDQRRQVTCLPLEYLNGWLFGIDVSRCREAIRPTLIQYKRECYAALAAYWQQGKAADAPAPSLLRRRWLVSFDRNGKEVVTAVPQDACVLTLPDFLKALAVDGDLGVTGDELFEFAIAALANLRRRSAYMTKRLSELQPVQLKL
ncbi:phage antirepressor N-terminal domain-containing protein [Pseudomonas kuykendallii]|uniref:P22_AR N-terminal domain-containing protein n=1 Tax=Pseudomonas kuykendallii TaxID=1007099 RepID=A0A1H3EMA6_9PSED|nr:phage antirepressor N-terminal domain-containing protein [Pseudomonas kuykendallii]MCQ4271037.1 phage antirepressor N-terminal domain-containing protein [Pseudomonas kuykendallii]SDX79707.1 P22_AR N-terminal domain-containing protein [Pseudomonas kuykendallii]